MEVKCIFCRLSLVGCPCSQVDAFFKGVVHIPKGGKPPVTPAVPLGPSRIIILKREKEKRTDAHSKT